MVLVSDGASCLPGYSNRRKMHAVFKLNDPNLSFGTPTSLKHLQSLNPLTRFWMAH